MTDVIPKDILISLISKYVRDNVFTCLPAKVISVSEYQSRQCVDVIPLVSRLYTEGQVLGNKGNILYKVPVVNMSGGGGSITVPIKTNDNVLLIFGMRDLDSFKLSNGTQESIPGTSRNHSLNDAIAFTGLGTLTNNSNPNPNNLEIKFGDSIISLRPDGTIYIDAETTVVVNGATVTSNGNVITANGTNLDDFYDDYLNFITAYNTHTHSSGGSGPPNTPYTPS